jgi:hypothetical protein
MPSVPSDPAFGAPSDGVALAGRLGCEQEVAATQRAEGWTRRDVGRSTYLRWAVRTPWLNMGDDLGEAIGRSVPPLRRGDTVVVTEKVAVLLTGRAVDVSSVRVGWLARLLARSVRPRPGSRGLSVPEKMQYVVDNEPPRDVWRLH